LLRVCNCPALTTRPGSQVSGGYIGGVLPVPIPNTEVKPSRADGTARPACGRVGRCRNFLQDAPPLIRAAGRPLLECLKTLAGSAGGKGERGRKRGAREDSFF